MVVEVLESFGGRGGWGGGPLHFSVTPVQTESLEFRVRSQEFVWTSSGLSLDNKAVICFAVYLTVNVDSSILLISFFQRSKISFPRAMFKFNNCHLYFIFYCTFNINYNFIIFYNNFNNYNYFISNLFIY